MNKPHIVENVGLAEFPLQSTFDAAVIGAGPNGLMTALYLQDAGLQTVLLERRGEIGGGLATEEIIFPGYFVNTHAQYHYMIDYMPVLTDFDLAAFGLDFYKPSFQTTLATRDGQVYSVCRMLEDSRDSANQISLATGNEVGEALLTCERMVKEIIGPATYLPPIPPMDQLEIFARTKTGQQLANLTEMSPIEVVESLTSSEPYQALLLYMACQWGISPFESGMGFMVPLLVNRGSEKAICLGGSHRFASAMAKTFLSRGGTIVDAAPVTRLLATDGAIQGAVLIDGREVYAPIIASSLDPRTNFLELLPAEETPTELHNRAEEWQPDKWSLFTTHLVCSRPPRLRKKPSWFESSCMTLLGFDGIESVLQAFADVEEGKMPQIAGHFTCLSDFDPAFGNPGKQALGQGNKAICTFQMVAPYHDHWDADKKKVQQEVLAMLHEYLDIEVERAVSETPADIVRRMPHMRRGGIKHGDYSPLQMGMYRPDTRCHAGRTPIRGFYLCGASSYPGGMVIGGPGYIAARSILRDAGRPLKPRPEALERYVEIYGDSELLGGEE